MLFSNKKKKDKKLAAILEILRGIAHNQEIIYDEILKIKEEMKRGDTK